MAALEPWLYLQAGQQGHRGLCVRAHSTLGSAWGRRRMKKEFRPGLVNAAGNGSGQEGGDAAVHSTWLLSCVHVRIAPGKLQAACCS